MASSRGSKVIRCLEVTLERPGQWRAGILTKCWNDVNCKDRAKIAKIADFLQDVRNVPTGANLIDNNLMLGADYFYQTWKICEAKKPH